LAGGEERLAALEEALTIIRRLWEGETLDPEQAPELIETYQGACAEAGREPGEIVLRRMFSWAESDEDALEGARVWMGAGPPEYYVDDWHDPRAMYAHAEQTTSDAEFKEDAIIASDPEVHAERIREAEQLGATTIAAMNVSGDDPHKAVEVYGDKVLPALAKQPAR
jgi:coenzyme F420-dependent glucose-6-phosphate dehydrogenase